MEFSEKVLILSVGRFREADMWVRFLSPSRGLLSAFAFGAGRSRRRFPGCLDLFNEVLIKAAAGKRGAYLTLEEGVLTKGPQRLRKDWNRLGLAGNCAKFAQTFGVVEEGAAAAYFLFTELLQLLEEADILPPLLPLFFRARLAFDQGYSLCTTHCAACGQDFNGADVFFPVRDGRLLCSACAALEGPREFQVPLDTESLRVVEAVQNAPPSTWCGFVLSPEAKRRCGAALDGFIRHHVGLVWENGRFIRV